MGRLTGGPAVLASPRHAQSNLGALSLLCSPPPCWSGHAGAQRRAPPPRPPRRPPPRPNPHLTDPASVDVVVRKLAGAGIRIQPNNASSGRNGEPVKAINFTYDGWPLVISQFSSSAALRANAGFDPAKEPRHGDATYIVAGLNILIEYGPGSHRAGSAAGPAIPERRDAPRRCPGPAARAAPAGLAGPVAVAVPEPIPDGRPVADGRTSAKASAAPTKKPSAKPSAKPAKATPKPTKKP